MAGFPDREQRQTDESWGAIRSRIWQRDRGVCQVCRERIPTVDYECGHIVDRCAGGSDLDDNLVVMCISCNRFKPVHASRAEYDAWVDAGGWQTEHLRDPVIADAMSDALVRFAALSAEQRAEALAFLDGAIAGWHADRKRRIAEEDRREALWWRRVVGRPSGVPRRPHQQAIIEALWKRRRAGMTAHEIAATASLSSLGTLDLLVRRGEVMRQRALSDVADDRYYAAMPEPSDDLAA